MMMMIMMRQKPQNSSSNNNNIKNSWNWNKDGNKKTTQQETYTTNLTKAFPFHMTLDEEPKGFSSHRNPPICNSVKTVVQGICTHFSSQF